MSKTCFAKHANYLVVSARLWNFFHYGSRLVSFLAKNQTTHIVLWVSGMAMRVVEFSNGVYKIRNFLPKNQRTQRKFLNFENWTSGEPQ